MTNFEGRPIFEPDELLAEFALLFPHGWSGPDVVLELAPNGWEASPLAAVFHPSAEQIYEETVRMHRNIAELTKARAKPDAPPPSPEPTLEEIQAEHQESPFETERELQELVGLCLWDIFSDNHEVVADDGRLFDLGSSRSSAGFLADVVNKQDGPKPLPRPSPDAFLSEMLNKSGGGAEQSEFMKQILKEMVGDGGYTYLDFYMGTHMVSGRADLGPVYEMIFRRLHARGCDWVYHFPRLHLVDFRPLKKMLDEEKRGDEPEFAGYDPSAAFEAEQEDQQRDEELAKMRESLDEGYRESVEASRDQPPPTTVLAYEAVYGEFPEGWPPEAVSG